MTEITLSYAKAPLRVLIASDGLWFCCKDLFRAHGLPVDRSVLARFDPEHLKLASFSTEEGPIVLTAVSPLGVATIAASLPFPKNRILDAWVRKATRPLAAEHGFDPLEMTLLADGRLPVKHRPYSALEDEWYSLAIRFPHGDPRRANPDEPALFDQDPDLPPPAGARTN